MPVSKEKFKDFQKGFNKGLGFDPEEDMKKDMKKDMEDEDHMISASGVLLKKRKASDILGS